MSCWRSSSKEHNCWLTHKLDLGNKKLLTRSPFLEIHILPTVPIVEPFQGHSLERVMWHWHHLDRIHDWILLLLLSHFSRVWLCATPYSSAHQTPPFLGFSRQEHWSGLPFSSPRHESENWKWNCSVVSDSATPWTAAYQAPPSMGFSRQEYWNGVGANAFSMNPTNASV